MSAFRSTRRGRAAGLVLACAVAACSRPPPAPPAESLAAIVATCAAVVGEVEVRRVGRPEWSRVTTGAVLRDGDVIRTGAGAFARVEFVSGNGIELEEGTVATVDLASVPGDAPPRARERVALSSGVARGFFAERPSAEVHPLTVRGDGVEARLGPAPGARDVGFRLTATPSGTEVAVMEGVASLAVGAGEVSISAGQAVDLRGGGIGTTADLPEFPASVRPAVDQRFPLRSGPIALAWDAVLEARSYRVQIARDLSFREVVLARDVEGRELAFAPPAAGMYAWRVASRDAAGRCGEFGFARRVYFDAAAPRGGGRGAAAPRGPRSPGAGLRGARVRRRPPPPRRGSARAPSRGRAPGRRSR